MKRLLDESYHQSLRIDSIAKQYGFTRNHLYTLFKDACGVSPQSYLLTVRVEKAKALLSDKHAALSASEVAFAVGFNDPLYFSRVFRKRVGALRRNTEGRRKQKPLVRAAFVFIVDMFSSCAQTGYDINPRSRSEHIDAYLLYGRHAIHEALAP